MTERNDESNGNSRNGNNSGRPSICLFDSQLLRLGCGAVVSKQAPRHRFCAPTDVKTLPRPLAGMDGGGGAGPWVRRGSPHVYITE